MKCIPSSIFGRFIGKATKINLNNLGLSVEIESSVKQIKWQDLLVPPIFHISFFGQIVTLKTANESYVFTMLAYSAKHMQKRHCEQFWVAANTQRLDALLRSIKKITTEQYIRQSSIEGIQTAIHQEFQRWFPWIKRSKALALVAEKLQRL